MSAEDAAAVLDELLGALMWLVDDFARTQQPVPDDTGDLDAAAGAAMTAFSAMADVLAREFDDELESLNEGAELDEVMSLLARRLDDERVKYGAEAAIRLLYVIQRCNYGSFRDTDPEAEEPDLEGDVALLEEGLGAILEFVLDPANDAQDS
ncbi:MAG: hypothetical protein AB1Z98_28300 [Nannocystaceae bacterium]